MNSECTELPSIQYLWEADIFSSKSGKSVPLQAGGPQRVPGSWGS